MLKLRRRSPFYMQPWFWTFAIVLGQYYGVWWQSLGQPEPVYVSPRYIVASVDAFNVTITAPGRHPRNGVLRSAAN